MRNAKLIIAVSFMVLMIAMATGLASAESVRGGPASAGPVVITGITVSDHAVEIKGSGPFAYTIYKPSDPYKVIVEIPGGDIGTFTQRIPSNRPGVTEIVPSQVTSPKPAAKVEILLQTPAAVDPHYSNGVLVLKVKKDDPVTETEAKAAGVRQENVPGSEPQQEVPVRSEGKLSLRKATEISDIGFDQGAGVVRVVVKGNGSMTPTAFSLKNRVVVDIPDVALKAAIPTTVVSPVKALRAGKHKDKTRLVVDLKEARDFDVLTVKETVIIAIQAPEAVDIAARREAAQAPRPVPVTENREAAAPERMEIKEPEGLEEGKYTGKKISLDFQDSDIVPVFRLLADISGYNVVIDPSVKGRLTMKLINVPWDQALEIILKTFSLGKSVEGNIIRIAPLGVFAKENDEKAKAIEAKVRAEPLETKIFPISYAKVGVVEKAIKDAKVQSPRGSVTIDERTSSLIIKDVESAFPLVENLLLTLDKPTPQVLVEGRIVEMDTSNERDLGIQWGINIKAMNTLSALSGYPLLGTGSFTGNNFMVDVPANVAGRGSGIAFGFMSPDKTFGLDLQLSAIETMGKAKIISNPRILTVDNGKAKILQGKSIPVRKLTSEGTVSTEFKDINIELNVVPHITPDKSIGMEVEIKKEELDPTVPSIEGVPGTDKKEAKTNIIIRDGETVVIGGLYKVNTDDSQTGVPGLMRLPFLGSLFKKDLTRSRTTELLIFITPRIVEKP